MTDRPRRHVPHDPFSEPFDMRPRPSFGTPGAVGESFRPALAAVPVSAPGAFRPPNPHFVGTRAHAVWQRGYDAGRGAELTHGRHCHCSACARQDWTDPRLAPCGIHGPGCPPAYAPGAGPAPTGLSEAVDRMADELTFLDGALDADHPEGHGCDVCTQIDRVAAAWTALIAALRPVDAGT